MAIQLLSVQALKKKLDSDAPPVVLDVREDVEWEIARLEPAVHVPLSRLDELIVTLDKGAEYAVLCHHGIRSADAARFLRAQGFSTVSNVVGGIDAWAREVDPSMERY